MRRADYLRQLREAARTSGSYRAAVPDRSSEPLLRRSAVVERALASIMRDVGLTEDQIAERFGSETRTVTGGRKRPATDRN